MNTVTAYRNTFTGQAFQSPASCLKSEFEHILDRLLEECKPLMLGKHYPQAKIDERIALLRAKLDELQAKTDEFYALFQQEEHGNVIPLRKAA